MVLICSGTILTLCAFLYYVRFCINFEQDYISLVKLAGNANSLFEHKKFLSIFKLYNRHTLVHGCYSIVIMPLRMRRRHTVVGLCICVCVSLCL